MSWTAIASLEPPRRATVAGTIRSVHASEDPYLHTEAELDDGTGAVVLRFMGRTTCRGCCPAGTWSRLAPRAASVNVS